MTLRDLYNLTAAARGHWVVCGTPPRIADTLEEWFVTGAADGFNILPPYFPGAFAEFVDLVVPELQRRGLFRRAYAGRPCGAFRAGPRVESGHDATPAGESKPTWVVPIQPSGAKGEAEPSSMEGTADVHHQIADSHVP